MDDARPAAESGAGAARPDVTPAEPRPNAETVSAALGSTPGPGAPTVAVDGSGVEGIPVQGTAIVGIGLVLSQVVSMLQMLIVSRILGPEEFGAFGAMAVILLLGSTAMVATQVVIARHVASGRSERHVGASPVLAVGAVACAGTVLLAPLARNVLNLSSMVGVALVGLTFVPLVLTGAQLGVLQGAEHHRRLGSLYVVSTSARVVGAILGAAVGGSAEASMVGLAIGASIGALAGQFLVSDLQSWGSREEGTREFLIEVLHAAHALLALYALTNVDVLIARAELPPYDAGLYAAGSLVARAAFFLPQAILVAAFPRMVAGVPRAQRQAVLGVAGLGMLTTVVVAAVPTLVITIIGGSDYLPVSDEAWIFALAGAGFAVVQVLLYARMAHHDRRATLLLWLGAAGLTAVGLTFGTSIHALVSCTAAVAWTVALAGLVWARLSPAAPRLEDSVAAGDA